MIKPIGETALVRLDVVKLDKDGILVPDWVMRNNTTTGTVVAVGDRVAKDDLHVGDVVLLPEEGRGTPIIQSGVTHYLIQVKNILGVVG